MAAKEEQFFIIDGKGDRGKGGDRVKLAERKRIGGHFYNSKITIAASLSR
ncbi:MAG: hypothetical protein J7647_32000 [Cyanobacteria bacterium SBLK]|nr:hypothetical protein [Cyanobacteria bacterium SBLK]